MTPTTPNELEHFLVTIPLSLIFAWAIYYEYSTHLIRNHLTFTGALYFLCIHVITGTLPWYYYSVGAALMGVFLFCLSSLFIILLKGDLLGLGTIKFGMMLTAALGPFGGAVSFATGTATLFLFGVVHIVVTRSRTTMIPTTPFWALGALSWLIYTAYVQGAGFVDFLPPTVFALFTLIGASICLLILDSSQLAREEEVTETASAQARPAESAPVEPNREVPSTHFDPPVFEKVRNKITATLVSPEFIQENPDFIHAERIEGFPAIFGIDTTRDATQSVSRDLILRSTFESWGRTTEELYDLALENSYEPGLRVTDLALEGTGLTLKILDGVRHASLCSLTLHRYPGLLGTFGSIVAMPARNILITLPVANEKFFHQLPAFRMLVESIYEDPDYKALSKNLYLSRGRKRLYLLDFGLTDDAVQMRLENAETSNEFPRDDERIDRISSLKANCFRSMRAVDGATDWM